MVIPDRLKSLASFPFCRSAWSRSLLITLPQLPSKEVVVALERIAAGKPSVATGAGKVTPKQFMDQYICAIARFQVACSSRVNDLQGSEGLQAE